MKKIKNLLVLSNDFPDKDDKHVGSIFVKGQLDYLKAYFENIYVIIPVPYGLEKMRKIRYRNYQFSNVKVYFLKYFNNPIFYFLGRKFWIYLERRAISKLIKREKMKFDLMHAHFTWHSGAVAALLSNDFDVPLVITEHTSETFIKAIKKKDDIFVKAWKSCDSIIRVRQGDIKCFYDLGIPPRRVHYIPNGFDNKKFYKLDKKLCRAKLNLPFDKKIILYIANLYDEVKGHKYLNEAIKKVIKSDQDILCILIGDGELRNKIENQIDQLGLNEFVKLLGSRSHDEIPLWMNAADVFVLPSLSEGNPTVLFEALSVGLPFIGTKVGGIPEIITSEDYGLLVEPANPDILAEKILAGLEKEWDKEKIIKYAEQFTWDHIAKQIMEVLTQL